MQIDKYIAHFDQYLAEHKNVLPWVIVSNVQNIVIALIEKLDSDFTVEYGVAIHNSATIQAGAIIHAPAIVGPESNIGNNACLRSGVFIGHGVRIGIGCEIKSSFIFDHTAIAHFNFVGDSIIGNKVNMEAGAVIANHYNERADKQISVVVDNTIMRTHQTKFGAIIGDDCKIGANAVLSPGTILLPKSIVGRLQLINQIP